MPHSSRSRGSRSHGRGRGRHHRGHQKMNNPQGFTSKKGQESTLQNSNDGILLNTIVKILHDAYPNYVPFHHLLNSIKIKHSKKDVNHVLYQLQSAGNAQRTVSDPPEWKMVKGVQPNSGISSRVENVSVKMECNVMPAADNNAPSDQGLPNSSQSSNPISSQNQSDDLDDGNLLNTIVKILHDAYPNYVPFHHLLNSIKLKHSIKDVKHVLYQLQSAGNAQRTVSDPPEWKMVKGVQPNSGISSRVENVSVKMECNVMPAADNNAPSDQGLPNSSQSSNPISSQNQSDDLDENMEYSDMPPLTDGSLISPPEAKSYNIGGSPYPSISIIPPFTHQQPEGSGIRRNQFIQKNDESLNNKLLRFLSTSSSFILSEILLYFKDQHTKAEINHALYGLQKDGLASRSTENPPKWQLTHKGIGDKTEYTSSASKNNETMNFSNKRQISPDRLRQMESVSISKLSDTAFEPPRKIPRTRTQNYFKDGLGKSEKNPISQLMEYAQARSLKTNFETTPYGPPHKTRFRVVATLGSDTYPPVEGSSKKEAKTLACELVLNMLEQSALTSAFTPTVTPINQRLPVPISVGNSSKNAISLVNEYAQANSLKIEFSCNSFGPDHRKCFRTILRIGDRTFQPVDAGSKKDSKLKAAEAALMILQESGKIKTSFSAGGDDRQEIRTFHDRVANMVNQKFHSLLADLPDTVVGRKILAGFVMSQTSNSEAGEETQWTVISIGSGNRCVAGDKLSMKGDTVNDCHAEIIARRGLLRYLYEEIESYRSDPDNEDNILQASSQDPSKLEIKPGIRFHLYISTAPCGDSALFAKSDLSGDVIIDPSSEQHHPLFENKKQGILRTKVENGEGCIPIDQDANVPTWDGLFRGERLRTMSCSDKLAKWNYVGLQGALLSLFIQPFYMHSLTLGMLFHHGHLTRAVCCRVDKYITKLAPDHISPLYKINHPEVAKVSGDDPSRDTGKMKTREYSLNWSFGDDRAEVLDGTKGRCEARYGCINPVSQVSKSSLYVKFNKISEVNYATYSKAKEAATEYKAAAAVLKVAFEKAECGTWMSKPEEVEEF